MKCCNFCHEKCVFFRHFWFTVIPCAGITEGTKSVIHFWVHIFSRWIQMSHFPVEKYMHQKVSSKKQNLEQLWLSVSNLGISPEFYNSFNNRYNHLFTDMVNHILRTVVSFTTCSAPTRLLPGSKNPENITLDWHKGLFYKNILWLASAKTGTMQSSLPTHS